MRTAVVMMVMALGGCGVVFDTVGCDFRDGSANGPEPRCQERSGIQGNLAFQETCEALGGALEDGGCPDEDEIVFGCSAGADVTDWYYPPKTADDADQECGSSDILDPPGS